MLFDENNHNLDGYPSGEERMQNSPMIIPEVSAGVYQNLNQYQQAATILKDDKSFYEKS